MFKKRGTAKAAATAAAAAKRRQADSDSENEKGEGDAGAPDIAELKEFQKRRRIATRGGVSSETLVVGDDTTASGANGAANSSTADSGAKKAEEDSKVQHAETFGLGSATGLQLGLNSNFGSSNKANDEETKAQKHLEQFLKDKLNQEFNEQTAGSSSSSNPQGSSSTNPQDLLSQGPQAAAANFFNNIPEHLRVHDKWRTQEEMEKNPIWATGLVEVEVSTQKRVENMIAAEEAKKKHLGLGNHNTGKGVGGSSSSSGGPGTAVSANQEQERAFGARFQAQFKPKYERSALPTDEAAVQQFKERTMGRRGKGGGG